MAHEAKCMHFTSYHLVHLLISYYQVYLTDIMGQTRPRELTSGKQGATHSPVFSKQGDKVAWLELDQDGYESDRAKIVIYDLHKDVRYTLTQNWDRSPGQLVVRCEIFTLALVDDIVVSSSAWKGHSSILLRVTRPGSRSTTSPYRQHRPNPLLTPGLTNSTLNHSSLHLRAQHPASIPCTPVVSSSHVHPSLLLMMYS